MISLSLTAISRFFCCILTLSIMYKRSAINVPVVRSVSPVSREMTVVVKIHGKSSTPQKKRCEKGREASRSSSEETAHGNQEKNHRGSKTRVKKSGPGQEDKTG